MDTYRQVFRHPGSTAGAELRGVPGRNLDYCPGSLFRFPAQYLKEPEPGRIPHGPVEAGSAHPRRHILNADGVIVLDELVGHLEVEVPPLIADFLVGFSHQDPGLPAAVGPLDPPGKPLLSHSENISGMLKMAGVAYLQPFRSSQEGLQPDINTYGPVNRRERLEGHILTGEDGMPLACATPADGHSLDAAFNRAGESKLEGADVSDGEKFIRQLPASLLEGEGVVAVPAFEAGEASFSVAILYPPKEASIGPVQAFQDILEDLGAHLFVFRKGLFESGEFSLLLKGG